jgi:bis(5'-nucleosidyl)-tetraphosphatase
MEKVEISCGVVPIRRVGGRSEVLLCKSAQRPEFVIPKGYKDEGESDMQTAVRELFEESGCRPVRFWSRNGWTERTEEAEQLPELQYMIDYQGERRKKVVRLYIAEVEQVEEFKDVEEIAFTQWFPVNETTAQLLVYQQNIESFIHNVIPKV